MNDDDDTKDAIIEALSHLPESINNQDIVTLFIMVLDGYGIGLLDAMELLHDTAQIFVTHSLSEGYDPFRPN